MDEDQFSEHSAEDADDVVEDTFTFPEYTSDTEIPDEDFDDDDVTENHSRFQIVSNHETYASYHKTVRVTKPYLTRFEIAKLIGTRAAQIENGAEPLCDVPNDVYHAKDIAELEFQERCIPFLIRRYLPNGKHEDWRLVDLAN